MSSVHSAGRTRCEGLLIATEYQPSDELERQAWQTYSNRARLLEYRAKVESYHGRPTLDQELALLEQQWVTHLSRRPAVVETS